jgi:hypothetical protein
VATFHTLPLAARDAAPDPLTPARHRLRQTIAAVDRARRDTEAAAEQAGPLTAPAKKSGQNIPKNRCRTTIAEWMVETLSGTAFYRGSGRSA